MAALRHDRPAHALPAITQPVTIDGTSQPGYAGTPVVVLDGAAAGSSAAGLTIAGGSSTVQGLAIFDFLGPGIALDSSGNAIEADNVTTDLFGTGYDFGFTQGIGISAPGNTIGGTTPGTGNLIAEEGGDLLIGSSDNLVEGNFIGTNAAGTSATPNGGGVVISASGNTIGGTTPGREI